MNTRAADAARLRAALAAQPTDHVSWHNLAAAEGDLGHAAEAEAAARRAIELGITAPETRLVLARALQSLRKLDEAESMFKKAIALRPVYADAHRDLAQLIWMRTGRTEDALKKLSRALRESPANAALHLVHSSVLEFAGDLSGAVAASERGLAHMPNDLPLLRQAAHLYTETGEAARAVSLSMRAIQLAPADTGRSDQFVRIVVGCRSGCGCGSESRRALQRLADKSVRACASGDCVEIAGRLAVFHAVRLSNAGSRARAQHARRFR